MHLGKRIALGLLLLPVAEVAVFLLVAWAVGVLPALALMVLTSFGGALVLRRAGGAHVAEARAAMRAGGSPLGSAVMLGVAGILLVLPGFITDLVGAGLLIGPIRRRVGAAISRALGSRRRPNTRGDVIDLAPTEWRPLPDREPPPGERR